MDQSFRQHGHDRNYRLRAHELGDVVFVELPAVGANCGRKLFARSNPSRRSVNFTLRIRRSHRANAALSNAPETVNSDPHGAAWLIKIKLANPAEVRPDGRCRLPGVISSMDARRWYRSIRRRSRTLEIAHQAEAPLRDERLVSGSVHQAGDLGGIGELDLNQPCCAMRSELTVSGAFESAAFVSMTSPRYGA